MTRNPITREPTPTDGRRLRWTQHRAERRAAFVEAGVQAIDIYGAGASAEQIAEEAGVSRTVLYRYFRDRDDLRQAIAESAVQQVLDSVMPKLQLTPQTTPHEIIHAAISVIVGWLDEHPNLYYFLRNRTDASSLESVEKTLADTIASLLKLVMVFFGMQGDVAEPGAYGIVGFVEASGGWWLQHRTMSREAFTEIVCTGVWHMLEGAVRDSGIHLEYNEPLPLGALTHTAEVPHVKEDDGYRGPAELVVGDDVTAVDVVLAGHFDPISGRYSWYGRVAASPAVSTLLEGGARRVVLRTPHASVETKLSDIDPWGRPRVEGFGEHPFEVLDTVPADER